MARDLGAFLDHLVASASATEAARFQSSSDRLPNVVATVEGLALHPYRPDRASADVRRARWLLRTQIGWPH